MRLKLLIFSLLLAGGAVFAQEVDKNLLITEARYGRQRLNYVEITNTGTDPINLMPYTFAGGHPWTGDRWSYEEPNGVIHLGEFIKEYSDRLDLDTILQPGESFWISQVDDWTRMQHARYPLQYSERICRDDQWNADIKMHHQEYSYSIDADSVTPAWQLIDYWGGRDYWFIAVYTDTDTIVVDQIGGVFDQPNGRNKDGSYDVAGINAATATHSFVRKFAVKEGNINFAEARGSSIEDSEWIPIPPLNDWGGGMTDRKLFWTIGNHGNYTLTEGTLQSDIIDVDWGNKVLNVPWGVHNEDSVMMAFDYTPGLAWDYQLNTDTVGGENWEQAWQDSGYISARTGDTLWILACGDDLQKVGFHINVLAPTEDANWVIPKDNHNFGDGTWPQGPRPRYEVSHGLEMDTIFDVPFATRTDTLQMYLEKASNATWEFVFVGGAERPDVVDGDILRITAENGETKDYYVDVLDYNPSHNGYLASITWPDAPGWLKESGIYGWKGDTIPGFTGLSYNYKVKIPFETAGIPPLIAKPEDLNTEIEVKRAVNLFGTVADKTVEFTVTAEDDTTVNVYKVQIEKEPLEENVQPWAAEPIIAEYVWKDMWSNCYLEIMNPGTEPIDLSNYMVMRQWTGNWETMLSWDSAEDEWDNRYRWYMPGYKWVDSLTWVSGKMRYVVNDFENVDPILQPGETFIIGHTARWGEKSSYPLDWTPEQPGVVDVNLNYNEGKVMNGLETTLTNPWGEDVSGNNAVNSWLNNNTFIIKIKDEVVADSIHEGLKEANDADDWMVVEAWGEPGDGGNWAPDGEDANAGNQCVTFRRKAEFYEPTPNLGESFAATAEESQWVRYDGRWGETQGFGWPRVRMHATEDLGSHFMDSPTHYKSTVTSLVYKVTFGYSMEEEIRGLVTGVTVSDFVSGLIKANEDQTLVVRRAGDTLAVDAEISLGDSLLVLSADSTNTSRYHLEVTDDGLSSDAVLTSSTYDIAVDAATGTVSGIEFGTTVADVVGAVTVPAGANMDVIDSDGKYVALSMPNFDTVYVNTVATGDVHLYVTAEDGVTIITYQMQINAEASDAYVLSDVYDVNQEDNIIGLVPGGTTVPTFYSNLMPAKGASIQLKDKLGFDRAIGNIYLDDRLNVTASDGATERTYFLAMLEREVDYLAYVRSSVYVVDQDALTIDGGETLNEAALVSDVLANLVAAPGASMTIMSSDMVAKGGDEDMDDGDILEVLAGNEVTVVYYDILVDPSSAKEEIASGISVYPNPSNGVVNVSGLETGTRIQVYNAQGARVMDNVAYNNFETISIEDRGMYIMVLSNDKGVIGNYKLVVE